MADSNAVPRVVFRPTLSPAFFVAAFLVACVPCFAQTPTIAGITDGAGYGKRLCPGIYAVVFGTNLGLPGGVNQPPDPDVSVAVNNEPAYVFQTNPTQLNLVFPQDLNPGPATVVVTSHGAQSASFPITLDKVAPAIFASATVKGMGTFYQSSGSFSPITEQSPAQSGETVTLLATGLGATNPVVPLGGQVGSGVSLVTQPTLTVGGQPAAITNAYLNYPVPMPSPINVGVFLIRFTVPGNLTTGDQPVVLTTGGVQSAAVTLPFSAVRTPFINAVVNSGNFQPYSASPGSIVSIFGLNFGSDDDYSLFPSTNFEGISVTFNGMVAPLFAVSGSQNQINVFVPVELQVAPDVPVSVQVTNKLGTGATYQLAIFSDGPGIYRLTDPSKPANQSAAALLSGTAWLAIPSSLATTLGVPVNCSSSGINKLSTCAQPAKAGDVIELFLTGLGKATPDGNPDGRLLPTGTTAPASGTPLYKTVVVPQVTIGNLPADVLFSGLAPGFAGLYQLNIRIPAGVAAGDNVPIVVTMPDRNFDSSTIAIQQ